MAKAPKNAGTQWDRDDIKQLKQLVKGNTPTGLIAHAMGRTKGAIYQKASTEGISLKPTNQSPYGTKKK